jgi:predicted membrane channel-forming protein YqfA (hemolysin III family)
MLEYLTDPLFWIILVWVFLPAILCYLLALKKRRSTLLWLLAGIFLGWIGVLILYFLPKLSTKYNIPKTDRMDAKLKMYRELEEMREAKLKPENENLDEP